MLQKYRRVSLLIGQAERSVLVALWILMFLAGNIAYVYYTFGHEELHKR